MSKKLKSVKEIVLEIKAHVAKEKETKDREFINKVETTYRLYRRNKA